MPKKKTKDNKNMLYLIIGALLVIVFMKPGMLKETTYYVTNTTTIQNLQYMEEGTCTLDVTPPTAQSGSLITGTIVDGPNALCEVFANLNGGQWQKVFQGTTNSQGVLVHSEALSLTGTWTFRAVCDGCFTNSDTTVITAAPPPEDPADDGGDDGADDGGDPYAEVYCESPWPSPWTQKSCDARYGCSKLNNEVCTFVPAKLNSPASCQCMPPEQPLGCSENLECYYEYGDGYICYEGVCTQVTWDNCMSMAIHEGHQIGVYPSTTYEHCFGVCTDYCGTCGSATRGGTLGDCCAYSC